MKDNEIRQTGKSDNAALRCQASPPHRILVVDDEPCIRQLNTKVLIDSGYHVDAAEDGAVAWDDLQVNSYDLLVTDNNMPKMSGVELIRKLHDARVALPVIMATAALPKEELTRYPWLQPVATLLKPYTAAEFLGTVKNVLCGAVSIVMLQLCLTPAINAQEVKKAPEPRLQSSDDAAGPTAVTLSARGKCEYPRMASRSPILNAAIFLSKAPSSARAKMRGQISFPAHWNHRPPPGRN